MPRIITVSPNPVLDRTMVVPDLLLNEVLYAIATYLDPSGKGFNVSRAMHKLGTPSVGFGFFGGPTGDLIQKLLREAGIDVRSIAVQGETRTNVVIADAAGNQHVKANEPGPHVTEQEVEAIFAAIKAELRSGDLCVMTGSLPRGVAPDFYARLIALVSAAGGRSVLDSSGDALRQGLHAKPHMLKINGLEANQALGMEVVTPKQAGVALPRLRALGIPIVAISLGVDGVVGDDGNGTLWAKSPPVQALNAVGAGDALMGGMIHALSLSMPFVDVLRWGVATATAKVLRPSVSYAEGDEVARWLDKVEVSVA